MTAAEDLLRRHIETLVADKVCWRTMLADDVMWELPFASALAAARRDGPRPLGRCRARRRGRSSHGAPINWAPTRCAIALAIGQGA